MKKKNHYWKFTFPIKRKKVNRGKLKNQSVFSCNNKASHLSLYFLQATKNNKIIGNFQS